MVNSREDFHLQDLAHAGRTNRPLAVATLSIPALKGEVFREFSIKMGISPGIGIAITVFRLFNENSRFKLRLFTLPCPDQPSFRGRGSWSGRKMIRWFGVRSIANSPCRFSVNSWQRAEENERIASRFTTEARSSKRSDSFFALSP